MSVDLFKPSDYKNKLGLQRNNLSSIIAGFKGSCTKKIIAAGNKSFAWQKNYYDHINRNNKGLHKISEYIKNNPTNWNNDKYN